MKSIEKLLASSGITLTAGVDEAGRGACAGPLVVAAVILRESVAPELAEVRDSKEISETARENLFDVIVAHSISVSVVEIPSTVIDERGVHLANIDGMRRAVLGLNVTPEYVLTDGYAIPGLGIPSLGVWKGDQVVRAISAASIIAKVTRDRIMRRYAEEYPAYGFESHKGYSTSKHLNAIVKFGPLDIHRRSFANISTLINS